MTYDALFDTVRRHLNGLGVACEIEAGKPAGEKALATAEERMKIRFPADVREFYATVGDGFWLHWKANSNDGKAPYASLRLLTLKQWASAYIDWRKMALYSPKAAERYGFPYTADPALAKRTAARMWHWLPVIQEGNGDQICLDLGDPKSPVIFNKHDWLDGGTGDNGHPLAPTWRTFLTDWGNVCFQVPRNLFWPRCFREGGGVHWEGEEFRNPYRLS